MRMITSFMRLLFITSFSRGNVRLRVLVTANGKDLGGLESVEVVEACTIH